MKIKIKKINNRGCSYFAVLPQELFAQEAYLEKKKAAAGKMFYLLLLDSNKGLFCKSQIAFAGAELQLRLIDATLQEDCLSLPLVVEVEFDFSGVDPEKVYINGKTTLGFSLWGKFISQSGNITQSNNEDWVRLNNNKFMAPSLGFTKLGPNLLFFSNSIPNSIRECYIDNNFSDFNLISQKNSRGLKSICGNFFITSKGTPAFEIAKSGQHLLVSHSWEHSIQNNPLEAFPEILYKISKKSSGGRMGTQYVVVPINNYKINININML